MPLRLVELLGFEELAVLGDEVVFSGVVEGIVQAGPAPLAGEGLLMEAGEGQFQAVAGEHAIFVAQLGAGLAKIEEAGTLVRGGPQVARDGVEVPLVAEGTGDPPDELQECVDLLIPEVVDFADGAGEGEGLGEADGHVLNEAAVADAPAPYRERRGGGGRRAPRLMKNQSGQRGSRGPSSCARRTTVAGNLPCAAASSAT